MRRMLKKRNLAVFAQAILLLALWAALSVNTRAASPKVTQVALGNHHSAAILSDGSLWMWGYNSCGELAKDAAKATAAYKPTRVMENVKAVSIGDSSTAAIKTDGSLWTWGGNDGGQLGDGSTTSRSKPVKVMNNVKKVSMGQSQCAAVKTDGSLWTWGDNSKGMLGTGTTNASHTPVKIMSDVKDVCMGPTCCAAIKTDGSLWMWGEHFFIPDVCRGYHVLSPLDLLDPLLKDVASVSLGENNGAIIKTDGSLWTWGATSYGNLGDGGERDTFLSRGPVKIMENVRAVCVSTKHSAALKSDGTLWLWGANHEHQIGKPGNPLFYPTPQKILSNVSAISLEPQGSAAVKSDGSLWIWGNDRWGQLALSTGTAPTPTALQIGFPLSDATVKLQPQQVVYKGASTARPSVTVTYKGSTLKGNKDYLPVYTNCNAIGQASVVVNGLGSYVGSARATYKIVPDQVQSVSAKSKRVGEATLSWSKVEGAGGYELQYYPKENTKAKTTKTFTGKTATLTNLDSGKYYTAKVRAYKKTGGKTYYGDWSSGCTFLVKSGPFVYEKGKYYYRGGVFDASSYSLDGPLIIEKSLYLPKNTSLKAKSITVKSTVTLGKKAVLESSGNFEVKSAGSLSMEDRSAIRIGGSYTHSPSGSAAVSSVKSGTISVQKNVTIKSKFQSTGKNVLELTGSGKTKVSCGKNCRIACLSLKNLTMDKVKLSGKGILNGIRFPMSLEGAKADLSSEFSYSAPTSGKKRDKAIEQAMTNALFTILYSNAYVGKDLLADFYDGFKGVAVYNKSEFTIPVMVKRGSSYEYGTVSGKMQGLGTLMFGTITYRSKGKTPYQTVCSPTLKASNKAVKSFMNKMQKSAQKEIEKLARDCLKTEFLGSLQELSDEFSWAKGQAVCEFAEGAETFDELKDQMEGWAEIDQRLSK